MLKNKLIVFIGKPGVGKSTIIKNIFLDYKFIDVLPFVLSYKINGIVPEEKTIEAYEKMYEQIEKTMEQNIVLEIGTNHPELNISNLEKLQKEYSIYIFLCEASNEVCRERVNQRDRDFNADALDRRLKRDFPDTHLKILKKTNLTYTILNMEKPLDFNIKIVQDKIGIK